MRSFHLLSLLWSCSLSQAMQLHGHEKPHAHAWHAKRDTNAVFTYFNDGQGACGITNSPNDFIVALNAGEYAAGAHCFDMITITVNGKMAQAQITDECTGCSNGGLDLSQSLFEYFAPLSEGQLQGSWVYNSDIVSSSSTTPAPTSYTSTSTPITTVATTTTTSEASLTTTTTFSATTIIASPTLTASIIPTSTPLSLQTIAQIDLVLVELGTLLQMSFKIDI